MRKAIFLLPLLAGVAATPAQAQVSGRAELKVGYDEPRATVGLDLNRRRSQEVGFGDVAFGAEGGVDVTFGGLLVGAYLGADFSNAEDCEEEMLFVGDELCMESKRNLYAGARAGLWAGDNGLIYIKGGYSRGKFRASYDDNEGSLPPNRDLDLAETSDTLDGYHLGAGFELGVTSNVYVKGEYVHTWYDDAFTDVLADFDDQQFEPTRHQLMFGVGLRFGGPREAVVETMAPLPPPPPPAAPATQTCADGSVILATEACPPPPPPPPSSGERG